MLARTRMRSTVPLLPFIILLAVSGDALADSPQRTNEPPRRTVVNRVVAVVDDEPPITLVELSARAAPYLRKVAGANVPEKERPAVEAQVRREMLQKIVAERCVEQRAREIHVTVDPSEVDRALALIAQQAGVSVAEVLAEAKSQGMTEAAYREELRRQILTLKLVRIEAMPVLPAGTKEEEAAKMFEAAEKAYLEKLTRRAGVEVML